MYAAVRIGKSNPNSMPEVLKRVEEEFVPRLKDGQGLVAYYLVDAGNDTVVTVSIFESQAAAEESNRMAQSWVKGDLAPLMAGPLDTQAGSVVAHINK